MFASKIKCVHFIFAFILFFLSKKLLLFTFLLWAYYKYTCCSLSWLFYVCWLVYSSSYIVYILVLCCSGKWPIILDDLTLIIVVMIWLISSYITSMVFGISTYVVFIALFDSMFTCCSIIVQQNIILYLYTPLL